jgi:hypothetical protein
MFMDNVVRSAQVIGVVKLFDSHLTFALPVFQSTHSKDVTLIQEISSSGMVVSFRPVKLDSATNFLVTEIERDLQLGQPALLAFEVEPAKFRVAERTELLPVLRNLLGDNEIFDRPFTRSAVAKFCGEIEIAEHADIQALKKFSASGKSGTYYRQNILIRDRIRQIYLQYAGDGASVPRFRLVEDDCGLTVELTADTSDTDIVTMKACLRYHEGDLAHLVRKRNRLWQCRVSSGKGGYSLESDLFRRMLPRLLPYARRLTLTQRGKDMRAEELVRHAINQILQGNKVLLRGDKLFKAVVNIMKDIYWNYEQRHRNKRGRARLSESTSNKPKGLANSKQRAGDIPFPYSPEIQEKVVELAVAGIGIELIATKLKINTGVVRGLLAGYYAGSGKSTVRSHKIKPE